MQLKTCVKIISALHVKYFYTFYLLLLLLIKGQTELKRYGKNVTVATIRPAYVRHLTDALNGFRLLFGPISLPFNPGVLAGRPFKSNGFTTPYSCVF